MGLKVLVMGGTAFFGKRLVNELFNAGCDVTVATRGHRPDPFGKKVSHVVFDRKNIESMKGAFGDSRFDIVFDQIGYAPDDIADAVEVFSGNIGRYVFTSTGGVYGDGSKLVESDFDPMSIDPGTGRFPDIPYSEGKQKAEAYLFQKAPFPAAAARLPIIIGPDDVTERFQFHVERVMNKKPIVVPFPRGRMVYSSADDAGKFIAWLGLSAKEGPYNCASRYPLDAAELTEQVGQALDIEPVIIEEGPESAVSLYSLSEDFVLDATKAENAGFHFTPFDEWFPVVTREAAERLEDK